ncbi:DUF4347 domain-containing protein [Mastigocoleus testarum]|uniref:DUF4347 domain-containing protein n=1 Tax=Mastigocoleus testarum BC008 TaxID=371196 RepID=A0A0V7ZS48_9CYAN|nr:DUF4347 domain-containing protein [Mastigocoleus testarum]KST67453.1 hypothetical protein BC008_30100 [Mastigocoleus testarum BC008]
MNYETNIYETNIYHQYNWTIAKPISTVIAFVDAEVLKNGNYLANINPNAELIVIDSSRDGIKQITKVLGKRHNIQTLQIIAAINSNENNLKLGLTELSIHNIQAYLDDLQQWKNALSSQSEILIYGCLVGVESIFQNFIHQLGKITGADIGAFVTFPDSMTANNQESDRYSLMVAWRS